jgi:hypothetical protein
LSRLALNYNPPDLSASWVARIIDMSHLSTASSQFLYKLAIVLIVNINVLEACFNMEPFVNYKRFVYVAWGYIPLANFLPGMIKALGLIFHARKKEWIWESISWVSFLPTCS